MKTVVSKKLFLPAILVLAIVAYYPVLQNGFTYYSDQNYILDNPIVHNLNAKTTEHLFTSYFDGHYHPITLLTFSLNYQVSGDNPFSYQMINLILHLLNVFLVFIFIRDLTQNKAIALATAALFAVHPLLSESVCRITERKDLLYTAFFFLAGWLYLKYLDKNRLIYAGISFLFFALSLLSKGQAVIFPVAILIIEFIRRSSLKSWKGWLIKLPFFAMAIIFAWLTMEAQRQTGYLPEDGTWMFYEPILHSHYVLGHYLFKFIIPAGLSAHYPYPYTPGAEIPVEMFIYLLVTPFILFILYKIRKNRIALAGLLLYLVAVIPMIRIIPVAENMMPDRYNYLASVGLFLSVVSMMSIKRRLFEKVLPVVFIIILIVFAILTNRRSRIWEDGISVWQDAQKKYPECAIIEQNLGDHYQRMERYQEAMTHWNKALQLDNNNFLVLYSKLKYFVKTNDGENATSLLNAVEQMKSVNAMDEFNKGTIMAVGGRINKALEAFDKSIVKSPYPVLKYFNKGNLLSQMRMHEASIPAYTACIEGKPHYIAKVYYNRAISYLLTGNLPAAKSDLDQSLEYEPDNTYYQDALLLISQIETSIDSTIEISTSEVPARAEFLLNRGAYFHAMKLYENYIAKAGIRDSLIIYKLFDCYLETGHIQKAGNLLEQYERYIPAWMIEKYSGLKKHHEAILRQSL